MLLLSPTLGCSCLTDTFFEVSARPYNSDPQCSPRKPTTSSWHNSVPKGARSADQSLGTAGARNRVLDRWSFLGGSKIALGSKDHQSRAVRPRKFIQPSASWMLTSQIAGGAITMGTVAVLPFYCLMIFNPNAGHTKKIMNSCTPLLILGALYGYLFYLAWTPDIINMLFSENGLPELAGIAKLFSGEMTLASAWIHLLMVDLYAARQIYYDGLQNDIETRHSILLCLFCCPLGIVSHAIARFINKYRG